MDDLIYLDAAASAPLAPEALEAMVEAMRLPGNPSAAHVAGHRAAQVVETARAQVASLVGVGPASVTFTGSATEANNLILRGLETGPERNELVASITEHPSVLETLGDLSRSGRVVRLIGVLPSGEVDLAQLRSVVGPRTSLVSVHATNNETGIIQPLDAIVGIAHEAGALVHSDASQLLVWGADSILASCDFATVSSHKMHGPQGAAAVVSTRLARGRLRAQVTGGGQEGGLRSGTPNVAAIAGFGAAAELAERSGARIRPSIERLRRRLLEGLIAQIGDVAEHSAEASKRVPGILNVAIGARSGDTPESDALLARLSGLAASTGSACHAGAPEPSPVLLAMGVGAYEAERSLRLSLSRFTTETEVDSAIQLLAEGYRTLLALLRGTGRGQTERCARA